MNQHQKLALAAAVFCASGSALAQETAVNPSWYIQPSINGLRADSDFGLNQGGKPYGYGGGLKFGKAISEHWDVQMGYVYGRVRESGQRYRQQLLGVDGLYLFSRDTFRPFLLIGAGGQNDRANLGAPLGVRKDSFSPYLSAGLGFQAVLNDRLTLQTDLRNVHGFVGDNFPKNNLRSNNYYLTLGLNIALDAPPAPPPQIHQTPLPAPSAGPSTFPRKPKSRAPCLQRK